MDASGASEDELKNVADDLGKMIRENQYLNDELQRSGRSSDRAAFELKQVTDLLF